MAWLLSPRAQEDLAEIWDYTAQRWGIEQAESYIRDLQATLELLAENPALGRSAEAIRAGYRKHLSGSHVIFYRQSGADIAVVRILHQRMDANTRF